MGAKKKAAPKKGGGKGGADEEDQSVENFIKFYKKRCVEMGLPVSKQILSGWENYQEEGEKITKFHLWEELGWPGIKAIIESLKQASYPHCQSIRLWKTYCEDEGVRSICSFLAMCSSILCLEMLDNKITPLGCEFLGKTLTPGAGCPPIVSLKLDHNNFGSEGVIQLCKGIQNNEFIHLLSLNYCNIDSAGAKPLFELLIFSKSKLQELLLTGNVLRNDGVKKILNGVSVAKELKKIYLADNQFNDDIEVLEAIKSCMTRNKTLARYDFRNNDLKDEAVIFFTEMIGPEEEGKISHVTEIEISERVSKDGGKKLVE